MCLSESKTMRRDSASSRRSCPSDCRNPSSLSCRDTRFQHSTCWASRFSGGNLTRIHLSRKPQRPRAVCPSCCFRRDSSKSDVPIWVVLTRSASIGMRPAQNREHRIVQVDHEDILCNWKVRVEGELWPSFIKLVEDALSRSNP